MDAMDEVLDKAPLTTGTPWKVIFRFALPLMAANILQQLYNTVDTLVVGNLDSQSALSAVGSCAYLIALYLAIATGFSLGAGVLVSQFYGGKQKEDMKKYAGTGIILLIGMGLVMTAFSFLTSRLWLTRVIAVPANILEQAMDYMMIYSIGIVFQFGYNIVAGILRAIGDSKSSLYFLLVSAVLNVVLDLVFVGVFHWGVAGVAWATTISQLASMVVCFLYMFHKYPQFRPSKLYWRWNKKIAAKIFITGLPMAIQMIITSCGFMLLQRLVNSFGEAMTASYTVACRLECYMLVPINSFSNAMATYAGQNLGANRMDRISKGIQQTVVMSMIFAVVIGVGSFLFAPNFVTLFGLEGQSVLYSTSHVRLVAFDLILFALYQPFVGMYQGVGKGVVATIISGVELTGRVVFAYLLSGAIGPAGAWWGEPFAWLIVTVIAYAYFFRGGWRTRIPIAQLVS